MTVVSNVSVVRRRACRALLVLGISSSNLESRAVEICNLAELSARESWFRGIEL